MSGWKPPDASSPRTSARYLKSLRRRRSQQLTRLTQPAERHGGTRHTRTPRIDKDATIGRRCRRCRRLGECRAGRSRQLAGLRTIQRLPHVRDRPRFRKPNTCHPATRPDDRHQLSRPEHGVRHSRVGRRSASGLYPQTGKQSSSRAVKTQGHRRRMATARLAADRLRSAAGAGCRFRWQRWKR